MEADLFENLLIGSGEANTYLAWALAKSGQRTAADERSLIGSSCANTACLPSKNVIHSAKVASLVNRAAEFGISTGPAQIEMAGVFSRKHQMVEELISEHLQRYHDSGAELIMDEARFTAPNTVRVTLQSGGVRMIRGTRVSIDVGTRASLPLIPGLAEARPMTHVGALNRQRLPEHLVVLVGGYAGLEFAQTLRRFGNHVTIIHRGEHLLSVGFSSLLPWEQKQASSLLRCKPRCSREYHIKLCAMRTSPFPPWPKVLELSSGISLLPPDL